MGVSLKELILASLVIIIEGSSCNSNKVGQSIERTEDFLAFFEKWDTVFVTKNLYELENVIDKEEIVLSRFKIKILDTNCINKIVKMNRPYILLKSKMSEAIGKPIHYSSSNQPPCADFFFLLEKDSNFRIGIDSNNEILCWKMKARIDYFIQDDSTYSE